MKIHIKPRNRNSFGIQKYNHQNKNEDIVQKIQSELNSIDRKIMEIITGLIQAQKVQIKSALTKDSNWIIGLQKKWINSAAIKSAKWHQANLIHLYRERNHLQRSLDKATGCYWAKKIKKIILIISLIVLISLGFALTIYLTPIVVLSLLVYILWKERR